MATTSRASDFDRVKLWGKAFLTAGEAPRTWLLPAGSRIPRGPSRHPRPD